MAGLPIQQVLRLFEDLEAIQQNCWHLIPKFSLLMDISIFEWLFDQSIEDTECLVLNLGYLDQEEQIFEQGKETWVVIFEFLYQDPRFLQ